MTTEYDVIVIGAGAVGENVADRTVQGGLSTLIVEDELVGGECSYWACMPSKALLRSGIALRAALKVGGAKQALTGSLDVAATLRRRDSFTHDWNDESQADWLDGAGIDLVRGHATITGVRELSVGGTVYTARHAIVVSTGSVPKLPDIPGLADIDPWTSRDATSAQHIPARLAIIGGGVVACEMATAYATLGAKVTLVARSGLLGAQEPFAAEAVADALREFGATVLTGVSPVSAARPSLSSGTAAGSDSGPGSGPGSGSSAATIELSDGTIVTADEVLVAVGREPRTGDLGLESIGLAPGEWLHTDDTMLVTGFDWLYAAGDVNHRALLTHQGKYQARAAGDVIVARALGNPIDDQPWGAHVATADHGAVPQVTFTDPEVASVGLTAAAAEKAGFTTRVIDYELGDVAGASVQADGYTGRARMVVDEKRGVIIGCTFVGQDVSEMIHAATIAIVAEVPLARLWHAVPAYPTMNEVWLRLLETYGRG